MLCFLIDSVENKIKTIGIFGALNNLEDSVHILLRVGMQEWMKWHLE